MFSKSTKINLYIVNDDGAYGVGTYINELTSALAHSSNVCVINLNSYKSNLCVEEINGIQYWHFPLPLTLQNTSEQTKYFRNVTYLLRLYIKDNKNLVFHLNYCRNDTLAVELKKAFNCKIVFAVHSFNWCFILSGNTTLFRKIMASEYYNHPLKTKVIEWSLREKNFLEMADNVICLSENTQQILRYDFQINPDKISVIYNGLTDHVSDMSKQTMRKKYNVPDIPIILFVGRLDDKKGLTYALRAFRTVLQHTKCHLIISGNGSFDMFMEECRNIWINITWTGFIDKTELYKFYTIADIGILPSFTEQCSYVAIEMMMHGLPMVTTSVHGLAEMTEDGISGLQIPVVEHPDKMEIDVVLFAQKLLFLLEHPEEAKLLGANARKRYEERYSGELFRKNMINFYYSLDKYPYSNSGTDVFLNKKTLCPLKFQKPIIIFRFYKEPVVCLNKLELLKLYNPDIHIYGIYGGEKDDLIEHKKILKGYFCDIYELKNASSEWKWKNFDLALLEWYREIGKHVDFSMAFVIEWDLLFLGAIEEIYANIKNDNLGLTGTIPLSWIENTWFCTSIEPYRSEWKRLLSFVSHNYQYQSTPIASLGPGLCFPKSFLEKYNELYLPELCHDELRFPLIAQLFEYPIKDTGFFRDWFNPQEKKYFNCDKDQFITQQTIFNEVASNGRKVFHPVREIVDLSIIISINHQKNQHKL